ncbi:hypothetical protein [Paenibacillus campi]|uniref:hypothetical protein n=1 Tax=Paenibacillus campi TaxID=3106031 RepID=UPI002AFE9A0D|nr:hypothetical protein [Paenibacillus sp. SGZ-1009]
MNNNIQPNDIQSAVDQMEQLLHQQRLSMEEEDAVQQLLNTIVQLQADNKRLRTALVKANSTKPKMSSRLKDALYE